MFDRFSQRRSSILETRGQRRGGGFQRSKGGGGRGGGNKAGSGPGGECVCPSCGHKEPHLAGQRCMDRICPKCGTRMVRE
jgi:hypothetical protein